METIIPINIEEEMKVAYIDYSMSVIISRALPDARDGLKPVHRRVLYAMDELGLAYNKAHKKSARIVGEVLGKYHPHGDTAVYDTMVRMAQHWSLRYMLVDGQGNFGSVDGDSPAAMRYTEVRLRRIAEEMLVDLHKNTVSFQPNFDDSLTEPTVLPSKIPNLLVNGSSGIAVGMATNMAPHNLSEIVDGIMAYIDNNNITTLELMEHIKAPDFPTGGIIYGYQGIKNAFETGRGKIILRSVSNIETAKNGRESIIVTEIPYQVNKADLIKRTSELVNEKKIEGISDIRDESDREGIRIVYELKKDANSSVVLYNLYKYTSLQVTFGINNVALVKGRPLVLSLIELIKCFVDHRHEIIVRRTQFDLDQAKKREHILEGLIKALDVIDQIITLIRASGNSELAQIALMQEFGFSELQAKAILEMRLQRLTGLEREKLQGEYNELLKMIAHFQNILADHGLRMEVIKTELLEVKEKYGDARRTQIIHSTDDIDVEDMITEEEIVVTISHEGYIKRTPLSEYRTQNRGGTGSRGATTKESDFTENLFVTSTHSYLLIFTKLGRLFWIKGYRVPEGSKTSKGRPLQNLINLEKDDKFQTVIGVRNLDDVDYVSSNYLIMCTEKGVIKKTSLKSYSRPRQNGINAISIHEGDSLLDVRLTSGNDNVVIALRSGRAIQFNESTVRPMGRTAAGVRGIRLNQEEDKVVGMVVISRPESQVLVVSERGYGKRSSIEDYRITNRGGKGVRTLKITEKTGRLVAIHEVIDSDQLMIITKVGLSIRFAISDLRVLGRATQGVRIIRIQEGDEISSVARIIRDESEEEEIVSDPSVVLEVMEDDDSAEETVDEGIEEISNEAVDPIAEGNEEEIN
ncbi:MAG: DNA gyrase subunit A [Bacteroidetes bacterium]|nr:MAG: DNA gyrase subunit A [Bacteroidota bacterium]